jgi:hypothetical protein
MWVAENASVENERQKMRFNGEFFEVNIMTMDVPQDVL